MGHHSDSYSMSSLFFQAQQAALEGIKGRSLLLLQAYLGISWVLGCCIFGGVVVNNSTGMVTWALFLYYLLFLNFDFYHLFPGDVILATLLSKTDRQSGRLKGTPEIEKEKR